ncbi:unnamed protein product [Owenia fusiformis]|uniref:Uncharacterized protein n=1 Tax=Owenia fusiformis TaxID=6347 RepID=A0A8J1XGJ8_OWEFU|nr:unnamed protein product [Owenia fusiformis]
MAVAKSFIEEYTELLKCAICMETVKTPKSLKCLHTFCKGCLGTWIKDEKDNRKKTYPCPVCKRKNAVPAKGARSYMTNFTMKSMAEALEKAKQEDEKDIECDTCMQGEEHSSAVARCVECAEYLCETCQKYHGRMRSTKSHKCIKLTGDLEKDSKIVIDSLVHRNIECPKHTDQPLKFYCKTHKTPVCRDCCMTDHSGHPCVNIEDVAKEELHKISTVIGLAIQKKDLLESKLRTAFNLTEIQGEKFKTLLRSIKSDRRAAQDELNKHFKKLESDAKDLQNKTVKQIKSHTSGIEHQKGVTESTLHHITSLQKYGHPIEIINSRADVEQTLQNWSAISSTSDLDALEKDIQIVRYKHRCLDTTKLGHIISTTDNAHTNRASVTSIKHKRKKMEHKRSPKLCTCFRNLHRTKNLEDNGTLSAIPKQCTPKVYRTEHLVDISDTSELSAIQGLCVGKSQQIVVSEMPNDEESRIVMYVNNGTTLNKHTAKEINGNGVCSVKDNYYAVAGQMNKCVAIYNEDLVQERSIWRFENPSRICVNSDGELIISDPEAKCMYIVDYNDGSTLATIGTGQLDSVRDLATNSTYAVIASDYEANCVKMFNRKGDLKLSYGTKGNGDHQLNYPCGLSIDSQGNIIIADCHNSRIHMLDPRGKFIKYLLTPEDNVNCPVVLAIDHNGDLLVGTDSGDLHFIKYMA